MSTQTILLDYERMEQICTAPIQDFWELGDVKETKDGKYVYIDHGSDVLAVAHLDSVSACKHFYTIEVAGVPYVLNAALDDRLGAYTILDLLPKLGINVDVLLTEGEEVGKSTAGYFETTKKYNWMVEFDRHGTDVALYQYMKSEFLKDRLKRAGFKTLTNGSFTDICYLDNLGCCGFNVAIAYEDEHSDWAKANLKEYSEQINKFATFFHKFKGLHFKWEGKPTRGKKTYVTTITTTTPATYVGHNIDPKGDYVPAGEENDTEFRWVRNVRFRYNRIIKKYYRAASQAVKVGDMQMADSIYTGDGVCQTCGWSFWTEEENVDTCGSCRNLESHPPVVNKSTLVGAICSICESALTEEENTNSINKFLRDDEKLCPSCATFYQNAWI